MRRRDTARSVVCQSGKSENGYVLISCFIYETYKSSLSLYSLYYADSCNEFAGPIFKSLRPGNTAYFEEMPQRLRAVGNTASDLTGPRFEPQTSRSKDELVSARPTTIIDYNGGVCWRTKNVLKIEGFAFFDNSRFMITE